MKTPTILIAEDDADDQLLLRAAFEANGGNQRLIFVDDGVELMHYLDDAARRDDYATRFPDFIIMDLNMPRKSGREALQEIKGHPVYKQIPVVIFTTTRDNQEVRRCYAMGANNYIVKPSTFEAMIRVVESLLAYWLVAAILPPVKDAAHD